MAKFGGLYGVPYIRKGGRVRGPQKSIFGYIINAVPECVQMCIYMIQYMYIYIPYLLDIIAH